MKNQIKLRQANDEEGKEEEQEKLLRNPEDMLKVKDEIAGASGVDTDTTSSNSTQPTATLHSTNSTPQRRGSDKSYSSNDNTDIIDKITMSHCPPVTTDAEPQLESV